MAFVEESGAGLSNANAYCSVAFADAYHLDRGNVLWTGTATEKQQAIIKATDYVDKVHYGRFRGWPLNSDQALQWPRGSAENDRGGFWNGVPEPLKKAVSEYAVRYLSADLLPDFPSPTEIGLLAGEKVEVGPIVVETKYASQVVTADVETHGQIPQADLLLQPLLSAASRQVRRGS
jgi:hypothetical protein